MRVSAQDKGTGKKESITITNDKGRLSKDEIDEMIKQAEEYAEEDRLHAEKIQVRKIMQKQDVDRFFTG